MRGVSLTPILAVRRDDVFCPVYCFLRRLNLNVAADVFDRFQLRLRGLVRGAVFGLSPEDLNDIQQMTWVTLQGSPPRRWEGVGAFVRYLQRIIRQKAGEVRPPNETGMAAGTEPRHEDVSETLRDALRRAFRALFSEAGEPHKTVAFLSRRVLGFDNDEIADCTLGDLLSRCMNTLQFTERLFSTAEWGKLSVSLWAALEQTTPAGQLKRNTTLHQWGNPQVRLAHRIDRWVTQTQQRILRSILAEKTKGAPA